MKQTTHTVIKLIPESGWITQSDNNIEIQNRIFAKVLYLGQNDSADNYKEIDKQAYDIFQIELQEYYDRIKVEVEANESEDVSTK